MFEILLSFLIHDNATPSLSYDIVILLLTKILEGALPLPWPNRMKIALGAAKGLAFLHGGPKPVIYRDFKTSNILLDAVLYFLNMFLINLI